MSGPGHKVVDLQSVRDSAGNQRLLERLFSQHAQPLRNFIRRRMGGSHEVEDVLQDVFAKVAKISNLTEKIYGDGRNYLFTVANNCIVDMERRRDLKQRYESEQRAQTDENSHSVSGPDNIVDAQRELETLKRVILELKPTWRQAFILNRFHHMTYSQVADHMGASVKQVENYIVQALARLRDAELGLQAQGLQVSGLQAKGAAVKGEQK